MSKYKQLGIADFGQRLIETGDLDPVYIAVERANLTRDERCKFHLGWMMYYHVGLACWLAKKKNIFEAMLYVAEHNDDFKRGTQRKHHRNDAAVASAQDLIDRKFASATEFMEWVGEAGPKARGVFNRVLTLVGWGPCFAWRIPDILNRNAIVLPTTFVDEDVDLFFSGPRKGAILCCKEYSLSANNQLMVAHCYVIEHLGKLLAPPRYERTINVQETETIFCKWKSHMSGRYAIGRDTLRSRKELLEYSKNSLAQKLLRGLPDVS